MSSFALDSTSVCFLLLPRMLVIKGLTVFDECVLSFGCFSVRSFLAGEVGRASGMRLVSSVIFFESSCSVDVRY